MKFLMTLILTCGWTSLFGQWEFDRYVPWADIQQTTVDNQGNLYLVNSLGDVAKFSKYGKLLVEYSAIRRSEVHQVLSTTQFKTILFYANLQEYVVLDRYLSVPTTYQLSDVGVNFASDMSINYQQHIWFIDMGTFSLKLIDPARNELIEEKSLAQILDQATVDIIGFKSYHNRTYLVDALKGVFVFDNMGNFISNNTSFNGLGFEFFKDEMYYVDGGKLAFYNMYTKELRSVELPIDLEGDMPSKVWFCGESVFVIGASGFKIYKYLSAE